MKVAPTILAILALSTAMILPAAAQSQGITPEDYFAFKFLNDVRFSPDGSTDAFVEPSALTTSVQSSASPRWSPDGRSIAFLSARPVPGDATNETPKNQISVLSLSGGEPRRVTNLQNAVTNFVWISDETCGNDSKRTGTSRR